MTRRFHRDPAVGHSHRMGSCLVTGAGGFVGRALVHHLLAAGETVVAVARHPGAAGPGLRWHAQDFAVDPGLPTDLLAGVERVFLLAALAHRPAPRDATAAATLRRVNVEHPAAVARQAAAAGVRRLVFLSSIGAQTGSTESNVTPETPCRPVNAYGASKRAAELALGAVAAETGLEIAMLRPPLVVGPGAPGNLARLVARARTGRPLPAGTRRNRRSLVGLTGLVEALVLASNHPAAAGATFLVAEAPPWSTGALYRGLGDAAGQRVRFLPLPTAPLDWLLRRFGRQAQADGLFGSLEICDPRLAALGWLPSRPLAVEIARAMLAAELTGNQ
jgi:nucleoside-diphosphate-sugar epimerase